MNTKKNSPLALFIPESIIFSMMDYYDKMNVLSDFLNEKRHRVDTNSISYRIINHWENEGLIDDNRPNGKGWRMYSPLDLIWLEIVYQSRKFGLSLDKIKVAKETIGRCWLSDIPNPYGELEFYVASCMALNKTVIILISPSGDLNLVPYEFYEMTLKINKQSSHHIHLNLNQILQRVFTDKMEELKPKYETIESVNKEERDILELIRSARFSEIRIIMNDGKVLRVESAEKLESNTHVTNIVKEKKYQRIVIETEDGKVVHFQRTEKTKLG